MSNSDEVTPKAPEENVAPSKRTKRYKAIINKEEGWTECFFDSDTFEPKHKIPSKSRSWTLQHGMSLMAHRWKSEVKSKEALEQRLREWGEVYNSEHLDGNVYPDVISNSAAKAADLEWKGLNSWYKRAKYNEDGKVLSFQFGHTFNADRYK